MVETPAPETPIEARARLRRQAQVPVGIALTIGGLLLAGGALPNDAGSLVVVLPYLAGALTALWVGGILLGRAQAGKRRRP